MGLTPDLSVISIKTPTWVNTVNERYGLFTTVERAIGSGLLN
jgi:hypothetical protein